MSTLLQVKDITRPLISAKTIWGLSFRNISFSVALLDLTIDMGAIPFINPHMEKHYPLFLFIPSEKGDLLTLYLFHSQYLIFHSQYPDLVRFRFYGNAASICLYLSGNRTFQLICQSDRFRDKAAVHGNGNVLSFRLIQS